jgi:acyl dehydratase
MAVVVDGVKGFKVLAGKYVGKSEWRLIDQSLIDLFAAATGDRNWLHCDPELAAKEGPFGSTIAHGYFTLSLVSAMLKELLEFRDVPMGLNYGLNKVRFPAPVKVNSRVRLDLRIAAVEPVGEAVDLICDCIVEIEGSPKPACVAQTVARLFPRRALA